MEKKLDTVEARIIVPPPTPKELDGEQKNNDISSKVYTGHEFLEKTADAPKYIIEGILYEGTNNMLLGRPKGGKSTSCRSIMKSVLDGEPYLGRESIQNKVLYCPFDEPSNLVKVKLQKLKVKNLQNLYISRLESSKDELKDIIALCLKDDIKLVVIDLLSRILNVEDNSKYSEVERSLRRFREAAEEYGITFLFLHHTPKNNTKTALGSQSLVGSMDNVIYQQDSSGKYSYYTEGRFESIPETEYLYCHKTEKVFVDDFSGLEDDEKVVKFVKLNPGSSKEEVSKFLKKRKSSALDLISTLLEEDRIRAESGKLYPLRADQVKHEN